MDIELILDSAEIVTAGLTDTARQILMATARDMNLSLELADVLARRAGGWPEAHITAAADELLTHMLAAGEVVLADEGVFMTPARIGARPIMTRTELDGTDTSVDVRDGRACGHHFRIRGDTL